MYRQPDDAICNIFPLPAWLAALGDRNFVGVVECQEVAAPSLVLFNGNYCILRFWMFGIEKEKLPF